MNDREFDSLLRTARDPGSLPSSFNGDVWSRIESRATESDLSQIVEFQTLPKLSGVWGAGIGIAAMVALGLWLGAATVPPEKDSKIAYAESISPFGTTHRK